MGFTLDNYTLLYIIIALFVVQLLITRYYVHWTIEDSEHTNNKKIVKKLSGQINTTFDQYMGSGGAGVASTTSNNDNKAPERMPVNRSRSRSKREEDSIEDPAEDYDEDQEDKQESDE